jgi:2-polyprenyl-6-hydroxyphenyl methylase / 3-demethylubiquinone-9 3-methyltransferase
VVIDNDVYDREGTAWWDENHPLNLLHGSFTSGRFDWFRRTLTGRLGSDPDGLLALDVGSGGGFLAEEFARYGCRVVGVDPSEVSVETARRHARTSGLDIDYRVGSGERLPVEDGGFDVVYCCDVLEHVCDLDTVVREIARALRPGGVFFFDTLNRTLTSKVLGIKVLQEWRLTRLFDTALHQWDMFITPGELSSSLGRAGLEVGEMVGLGFRSSTALTLVSFVRAQRGWLSYGELSRRLDVGPVRSKRLSYMGYATKPQ